MANESRTFARIVNIITPLLVCVFLISATLPKEIYQQLIHLKFSYLFLLAMFLSIARTILWIKSGKYEFRDIAAFPFILLFLIGVYRLSAFEFYSWGIDDSFYYSYVCSAVIDGDLDLLNQYEQSGLIHSLTPEFLKERTAAGYIQNIFPAGLSVLWSPFFLVGHIVASVLNLLGFEMPQNGYSKPYTHMVLLGNLFYVCGGLYVCYLYLRRFVSNKLSFLSTVILTLATPTLYLFFTMFYLISELPSIALLAFSLFLMPLPEARPSWLKFAAAGVVFGLLVAVRFHNAVFILIPGILLWRNVAAGGYMAARIRLRNAGLFLAGLVIGFLPQMIAWHIIYGSPFINTAEGLFPYWNRPFVIETLFSARAGLFPWWPIALLSLIGLCLFAKKNRPMAIAGLLSVMVLVYVNSSQRDWWGSASFGPRRFMPCFVLFALGLSALMERTRRKETIAVLIVSLILMVGMNRHLVKRFKAGEVNIEHSNRFSDLFNDGAARVYNLIAYPMQLPAQVVYRLRYGIRMFHPLNDYFVGDDILHFQEEAGSLTQLDLNSPVFGQGWARHENGQILLSSSNPAVLNLPLFFKANPRLIVEIAIEPVSPQNLILEVGLEGQLLRRHRIPPEGTIILQPLQKKSYHSGVNRMQFDLVSKRGIAGNTKAIVHSIEIREDK